LHALTGDQRFVEPLLRLCREADAAGSGVSGSKGSGVLVRAAVSDLYNAGVLDGLPAAALPPLLERDPALRLFAQHEAGPILDGIVGSERPEGSAINSLYDAARWPDMFTSVEQYTDRIFFSRLQRYVSLCYLGGYCGRGDFHPTTALSWEGFGTTIGALVLDNRRQRLTVAVYSYADEPLSGGIRVWRLDHGLYEVTTGVDGDGDFQIDTGEHSIQVTLARGSRLPLALAPQVVTVLRVVQIEARQPIHLRPDLAISARELQLDDGTVSGRVHNIGSVDVDEVVVGVVDAEGQVLERCVCGGLQAPRDLWPKTVSFALALPGPVEAGWEIVVDPEGRLDEIDKDNNRVALAGL
jgi:hypothetical protein